MPSVLAKVPKDLADKSHRNWQKEVIQVKVSISYLEIIVV